MMMGAAFSRRLMRLLTRCLLAAMVLATLAPAISRNLLASRVAGDWVEVCTSDGMRWVQLGSIDAPQYLGSGGENLSQGWAACGLCALAAERFAPLISALPIVAIDVGAWATPAHLARSLADAVSPDPSARGPPLLS